MTDHLPVSRCDRCGRRAIGDAYPGTECPKCGGKGVFRFIELIPVKDQPPPKPGTGDVWRLVINEMKERRLLGIERYGVPLQVGNGRDALVDAYQESLDLAVYLRQAIAERDGSGASGEALRARVAELEAALCEHSRTAQVSRQTMAYDLELWAHAKERKT